MTTDQLHLFLVITHHRSLSRAAAELELGQATVSERLRALENELGVELFERQGRGVALTAAGETFKPYAERALELIRQGNDLARATSEGRGGQVNIAVTVTSEAYFFAPALVAFQSEHPNIEVRVRSAHSWDAPGLILDGLAELALLSGTITQPQIESVATFTSRLVLAASKTHPRAAHHFALSELAAEQFLISYWGPASQNFLERIKNAGENKTGLWLELSPVELVKGMLLAGNGVSLVPEIAVRRELAAGDLVALNLADASLRLPQWEINLIRRAHRQPNPAADALAETLIKVLPTLTK